MTYPSFSCKKNFTSFICYSRNVFWLPRAMLLISADVIFPRAVELLSDTDIDLMEIDVPEFRLVKPSEIELGYGPAMVMWEIPDKPLFYIDESDLPY